MTSNTSSVASKARSGAGISWSITSLNNWRYRRVLRRMLVRRDVSSSNCPRKLGSLAARFAYLAQICQVYDDFRRLSIGDFALFAPTDQPSAPRLCGYSPVSACTLPLTVWVHPHRRPCHPTHPLSHLPPPLHPQLPRRRPRAGCARSVEQEHSLTRSW